MSERELIREMVSRLNFLAGDKGDLSPWFTKWKERAESFLGEQRERGEAPADPPPTSNIHSPETSKNTPVGVSVVPFPPDWYCHNCGSMRPAPPENGDLVCVCGHVIASYRAEEG